MASEPTAYIARETGEAVSLGLFLSLRDRLKARGLSDPIIRELEQMVPSEAVPLMRAILGENDATIKQMNAHHREAHRAD